MTSYIVYALLLALVQIWVVPAAFNMKNFPWLGSNRDEPMPNELSVMGGRASRASINLQESLPAFLALALLSMQLSVDVTGLAFWWLILRVGHLIAYISGVALVRTLLWLGSLVTLIMMALALI
ncbi:MAG: MAPEG family protein [Gammaproteobacteria bacterium]|jgi:uncharacterized MAPEG superfamily protein|nr:MAPEG family protein [Gammaproteobacteria bacterium]|tara:strand:+ start:3807 stop:4178 length:372 start_codon:yes stop_codon:yes gene_type:complete